MSDTLARAAITVRVGRRWQARLPIGLRTVALAEERAFTSRRGEIERVGRVVWSETSVYRREAMWWSIEVLDGAFPATLWQDAHGSFLIEAALTRRGRNWWWHRHDWGVVFEVEVDDEDAWEAFRRLPAVQAALDAVPDPVEGLLIYPGRGGSSGRVVPRWIYPTSVA